MYLIPIPIPIPAAGCIPLDAVALSVVGLLAKLLVLIMLLPPLLYIDSSFTIKLYVNDRPPFL